MTLEESNRPSSEEIGADQNDEKIDLSKFQFISEERSVELRKKHFGNENVNLIDMMKKAEELGMHGAATKMCTDSQLLEYIDFVTKKN